MLIEMTCSAGQEGVDCVKALLDHNGDKGIAKHGMKGVFQLSQ